MLIESLEPRQLLAIAAMDTGGGNWRITATPGDDRLEIAQSLTDVTKLQIVNLDAPSDRVEIPKTAESIKVLLGLGDDSLIFKSLGSGVTSDITIAGSFVTSNQVPVLGEIPVISDLVQLEGNDSVRFVGDVRLGGGSLNVDVESIIVDAGVVVSTRRTGGNSGTFSSRVSRSS